MTIGDPFQDKSLNRVFELGTTCLALDLDPGRGRPTAFRSPPAGGRLYFLPDDRCQDQVDQRSQGDSPNQCHKLHPGGKVTTLGQG